MSSSFGVAFAEWYKNVIDSLAKMKYSVILIFHEICYEISHIIDIGRLQQITCMVLAMNSILIYILY